ncbi:hypothetical protein ERC79_00290 [Rhodococcus sp. ABRD24]|uniref:hypothetical protein n=1 Tax=Rhodococcus sp. ABRD24 TaxID=2507582 RepID=UPI00103ADA9A|nr:hypothetical protein [Rhodococcus sp. ABRD24]QBJ94580.1 hypothetical protein ERC79_00290 [Rhodococcus sp. ABRD24]
MQVKTHTLITQQTFNEHRKRLTPPVYKVTVELPYPYIGVTADHLDCMEGVHNGFRPTVTEGSQGCTHVHLFIPSKTASWATMFGEDLITKSNPPQLRGPILSITATHATESDFAPTSPEYD